jgi:hypothetical protein
MADLADRLGDLAQTAPQLIGAQPVERYGA